MGGHRTPKQKGTTVYWKSLTELVVLTYAVTFVGTITATGFDLFELAAVKAAAGSAIPAALVVLYGAAAKALGNRQSALIVDTRDGLPRN